MANGEPEKKKEDESVSPVTKETPKSGNPPKHSSRSTRQVKRKIQSDTLSSSRTRLRRDTSQMASKNPKTSEQLQAEEEIRHENYRSPTGVWSSNLPSDVTTQVSFAEFRRYI